MELNPQQQLAVQAPTDKPLLIVAGAGTGKTKTLTARLRHLIENGVESRKICALTFTNKAAEEMKERIMNYEAGIMTEMGADVKPIIHNSKFIIHDLPYLGTFHSLGARILRAEAKHLGHSPDFVIFDDDDSFRLVKKICKELEAENAADWTLDYETESGRRSVAKTAKGPAAVARKISYVKNGSAALEALRDSRRAEDQMAAEAFSRYEEALRRNNAFDFDDLLQKVVALWRDKPEILQKYRRRFSHILVDEYQDLNNMQYEFIRLLAGDSPRLSVVGDDQQTIYSWRGSNFEIFLDFEKDWPESNVIVLEQNYRSTPNIIEAASAVVANNRRQKPKTLWTRNANGSKINIFRAADEYAEAGWVAERIAEGIMNNESRVVGGEKSAGKPLIHNSKFIIPAAPAVAVLYRTNAQSFPIEQRLMEMKIPYRVFGGLKFYERKEIKDIVSALRFTMNPADEISRERLLKNFRQAGLAKIGAALAGKKNLPPAQIISLFLAAADYPAFILKNFTNPEERGENIAELIRFAGKFQTLPEFLEQIALAHPQDEPVGDKRHVASDMMDNKPPLAVSLMTIHLAKGLEFDRVFVVGCAEGLLPHERSIGRDKELEEERRLMYVAMTRARKELNISCYDVPSRFIYEIPKEYVNFIGGKFDGGEDDYIEID